MATPAAVLAVVRASGQSFRGPEDAVVYAIHAALLASGCALVGVGDAATLEGTSADAPEVPDDGWAAHSDRYTFLYRASPPPSSSAAAAPPPPPPPRLVLLKVLAMGGGALVATLAAGSSPGDAEPSVLEIEAPKYYEAPAAAASDAAASDATAAPTVPAAQRYKSLDDLLSRVNSAVAAVTAGSGAAAAKAAPAGGAAAAAAAAAAEERRRRELEDRPQRPAPGRGFEDDPLRIGPPRRPNPLRAGEDDIMPLLGGGGGPLGGGIGGGPALPPGMGGPGGMHVGPGHPFFADRMRHPDLGPGGVMGRGRHPGGARWDPINPEGLEGWRPEDFERPPPGGPGRGGPPSMPPPIDPDLEQPGPGRTDWDSMYG